MTRTTARSLAILAVLVTAAIGACAKHETKAAEPSNAGMDAPDWGSGPYTEWKPIK